MFNKASIIEGIIILRTVRRVLVVFISIHDTQMTPSGNCCCLETISINMPFLHPPVDISKPPCLVQPRFLQRQVKKEIVLQFQLHSKSLKQQWHPNPPVTNLNPNPQPYQHPNKPPANPPSRNAPNSTKQPTPQTPCPSPKPSSSPPPHPHPTLQ